MKGRKERERIEFWRPPDLPGTDVLLAEHCARRWRVYHETYTVCTGLDVPGKPGEWWYRHKTYYTGPGGQMLMEPGEVHANTKDPDPATFRVLLIEPSIVTCAAEELGIVPAWPHFKFAQLSHHPALFPAFVGLHASLEQPSTTLERQSRFATCLRLLLEHCTETGVPVFRQPERSTLLRGREFIREHYSRPITLDELAAVTGLGRFHFVRAFATEFGLPPHAYQIHVRVAKARALLAVGVPLAMVATETGFADQSHFTRHFKRVFKVTPGKYLRRE